MALMINALIQDIEITNMKNMLAIYKYSTIASSNFHHLTTHLLNIR